MGWSNLVAKITGNTVAAADVNTLMENIRVLGGNGTSAPTSDIETNTANIIIAAPPGVLQDYIGATAPTGWLICNGATLGNAASGATHASADYEDLFDLLNAAAWGNPGGAVFADGDTVLVPDLRGMFTRGTGSHGTLNMANGNDFAGPAVGASENDQMQGHWHRIIYSIDATGGGGVQRLGLGSTLDTQVNDPVSDGTNGTPRKGDETRPVAYGVTKIIKY